MNITNNFNLPEGFVKAISSTPHNKEGSLSATTLISGMKNVILTQRHWNEITKDASDFVWATFGTAFHSIMESGASSGAEVSVETMFEGINITGRIDLYDEVNGLIGDYKTVSTNKLKFKSFEDYEKQGLIYAWILRRNGKKADHCKFHMFMKDWNTNEAKRDTSYPQSPYYCYEFDVTDNKLIEIEHYIKEQVQLYKENIQKSDDAIPRCSDKQIWREPTTWAIFKKGTSARCIPGGRFENKSECDKKMLTLEDGKYEIKERKGECKKCMSYCDCTEFCSFYKELLRKGV